MGAGGGGVSINRIKKLGFVLIATYSPSFNTLIFVQQNRSARHQYWDSQNVVKLSTLSVVY